MTREHSVNTLTQEQKGQICAILSVGCDRQTAADYVSCTMADIRRTMQHDSQFAGEVCRAEAGVELSHMRNVHEMATGEKKDWRASVWWLERRSPERFARRSVGAVTARQLKSFVAVLSDMLQTEIHCAEDRERVLARLVEIWKSVDTLLRDSQPGPVEPDDSQSEPTLLETTGADPLTTCDDPPDIESQDQV